MIGTKTEEMGSRKKLLAPVVVLLLCMVSLTGAAYAYSSTMTNTGNYLDAKDLSLDFYGAGATAGDLVTNIQVATFTDNFSYAGMETKSNDIEVQYITANIAVYKVKVTGDAPMDRFKVSSSNLAAIKPYSALGNTTTTMADLFTFTYIVGTTSGDDDVVTSTPLGTEATATFTAGTAYYVTVIAAAASTAVQVIEHVADAYAEPAPHVAADYKAALDNLQFTLTLDAYKA